MVNFLSYINEKHEKFELFENRNDLKIGKKTCNFENENVFLQIFGFIPTITAFNF